MYINRVFLVFIAALLMMFIKTKVLYAAKSWLYAIIWTLSLDKERFFCLLNYLKKKTQVIIEKIAGKTTA